MTTAHLFEQTRRHHEQGDYEKAVAGYETLQAADGSSGLKMAVKVDCDLILLDLVLPEYDGLKILKEVRSVRPTLPVIILTARGEEQDR